MIKIISVGKIKEKFYQEAIKEYQKRLQKYHKVEIIEVKDHELNDITSQLKKEKEEIEKHLTGKEYIITLEIEGTQHNSVEFSKLLDNLFLTTNNIAFIIGGSNGIHEELKSKKNMALSFSKMTFPHQLFRVILLEQIYRSFKIKNNENYHK